MSGCEASPGCKSDSFALYSHAPHEMERKCVDAKTNISLEEYRLHIRFHSHCRCLDANAESTGRTSVPATLYSHARARLPAKQVFVSGCQDFESGCL